MEYKKRRVTFSERWCRAQKRPKQATSYWTDAATPGLSFHITATGRRTFRFMYRMKVGDGRGPTRKLTLGTHPSMKYLDAQTEAEACRTMVANGIDPIAARADAALEERREESKTFEFVAEKYALAALAGEKVRKSGREGGGTVCEEAAMTRARDLKKVVIPALGHHPIEKLTRGDVASFMDDIEAEGGAKTRGDRMLEVVKAVFNFAKMRGYVDENPIRSIDKRAVCKPRKHFLNEDEIAAVWDAAGRILPDTYGALTKMLLLTGSRRGEMAKSKWGAVNFDKAVMKFPAEITKASRDHTFPLTQPAMDVLMALPRGEDDDLIFMSGRLFNLPLFKRNVDKFKRDLDNALEERVRQWTFHDLRRTVATGLAEMGYPTFIIGTVLNHAPGREGATTRGYIAAPDFMVGIIKEPMQAWADKIMGIVNPPQPGGNVTDINEGRKTA